MAKVELNPRNPPAEKKNMCDMIKWWIFVRNIIDGEIDGIFNTSQI